MSRFAERRDRARAAIRAAEADALLVTQPANVRYLTGFTGEDSYLLLGLEREILLSDTRFILQIAEDCPELERVIRRSGTKQVDVVVETAKSLGVRSLALEAGHATLLLAENLKEKFPEANLLATTEIVNKLREKKDETEIATIRRAIDVAERALHEVRGWLRPEHSEIEVQLELDRRTRALGGDGLAFTPIIGLDAHAALPHYRPGRVRMGEGRLLLVDWGALVGGYVSDLTRTFPLTTIPPKLEAVYEVVFRAQAAGIAAIRPGAKLCDVDAAARKVIEEAGYGEEFGHGLGHGIGLQVHEAPRFAANEDGTLEAGMVMTVEPGIYLAGVGGVRLEDDVLVTPDGAEVLSRFPKDLDTVALRWS